MSRGVLQRLSDTTLVALSVAGAEWPRSLLSASVIPDAWMGLVFRRDGRRRFVPSGENPRPEDDDTLLLVRNRLITVPLDVSGCKASCGNIVDASCEMLLKWSARDDDLAALQRSILIQPDARPVRGGSGGHAPSAVPLTLSLDRLAQTVSESGARIALQKFVREHAAARLVTDDVREEAAAALRDALAKFLFEVGATLDRVAKLHFSSRTLAAAESVQRDAESQVQRIRAREMVEQAAIAATHKRLGELSGVFDKLKAAAAGDQQMQWHDLLPSLSPAERGRLLENLWRISPDRRITTAIVIIAGNECVWLDPAAPDRIVSRATLPGDLGGLRSVAFTCDILLVGAASGVWAADAATGEVRARCAAPAVETVRTGFNAAASIDGRIYATHSQLGLWSWPADGGASPQRILVPENGVPKTIRSVCRAQDGRVFFAADDCVQAFDPAGGELSVIAAADDTVHCLAVLDENLFVGCDDGKLLRLDLRRPDDWWVPFRASSPIESLQVRRWADLVEVVAAAGAQGIVGIYADQNVTSRLVDSPHAIRRVWVGDDLIVGLNDRRDRLIVMSSNSPDRAGREVNLSRALGSSIQDGCLVARAASA